MVQSERFLQEDKNHKINNMEIGVVVTSMSIRLLLLPRVVLLKKCKKKKKISFLPLHESMYRKRFIKTKHSNKQNFYTDKKQFIFV